MQIIVLSDEEFSDIRDLCNRLETAEADKLQSEELQKNLAESGSRIDALLAKVEEQERMIESFHGSAVADLHSVKEEILKLKEEGQLSKDHMLQYEGIAQVNESALKQMEVAHEKYNEIKEQNMSRLEALHIAEREHGLAGNSSRNVDGDAGLQNAVKYLRRMKEIAETEISLSKHEKFWLQAQLDSAIKTAETSQASLRAETSQKLRETSQKARTDYVADAVGEQTRIQVLEEAVKELSVDFTRQKDEYKMEKTQRIKTQNTIKGLSEFLYDMVTADLLSVENSEQVAQPIISEVEHPAPADSSVAAETVEHPAPADSSVAAETVGSGRKECKAVKKVFRRFEREEPNNGGKPLLSHNVDTQGNPTSQPATRKRVATSELKEPQQKKSKGLDFSIEGIDSPSFPVVETPKPSQYEVEAPVPVPAAAELVVPTDDIQVGEDSKNEESAGHDTEVEQEESGSDREEGERGDGSPEPKCQYEVEAPVPVPAAELVVPTDDIQVGEDGKNEESAGHDTEVEQEESGSDREEGERGDGSPEPKCHVNTRRWTY